MKYKLISAMIASLSMNGALYADATPPAAKVAAAAKAADPIAVAEDHQEVGPAMLLEQGMAKMLEFLGQEEAPKKEALAGFLEENIAPLFDFAYMAKSAAGPMYRHMDAEQRDRLSKNIKEQFMATMVDRLMGYNKQQVRVVSQRYGQRGYTATVTTAIMRPHGYPARLDFRFYRAKEGWKVFDVAANGQSAVIYYRRQFRQMMYAAHYERRGMDGQRPMQYSFRHPTSQ